MTRKETIKWLESLKAEIGKSEHRTLWHYAEAIDMAIEALRAEPKTGEWVETVDGNGWNEWGVLKCPLCGATIEDKQYRSWEYNFCPSCGADMRGAK